MPSQDDSLLPQNRSTFEEAQSLVGATRRPLPAHLIRDIWDPATCPADIIPFQVEGLGLELWRDSWPEAKKRWIYQNLWKIKRNKTKLKGINEYLQLMDASVVKAVRPKDKVFAVDPWTHAERAAIEADMPQIHIFPTTQAFAVAPGAFFVAGDAYGAFLGWEDAMGPSDAVERFYERAVYVDQGVSTPCFVQNNEGAIDGSYSVTLNAEPEAARLFLGQALEGHALFDDDSPVHVVSVRPDPAALSFAIPKGLIPATVHPVPTADLVAAPPQMAFGDTWPLGVGALYPDDAALHVYDRLTLLDVSRIAKSGTAVSFWGWSSFGCEPYTAELTIDVKLQGVPWGLPGPLGLGVVVDPDLTPYWDALEAVHIAQAARDTVFVSTKLYEQVNFNSGLLFGRFNFGDYRKV